MNVLVTGATGFVGSALIKRLSEDGKLLPRAAMRRAGPDLPACVEQVRVGDLGPDTDWSAAFDGVGLVVHAAARVHLMSDTAAHPLAEFRCVNVEGTLNLARQAASAKVKRLVFLSSIKVNGESTCADSSFSVDSKSMPRGDYAISKWEAEQGLIDIARQTGMEVVILRIPLVYGPNVRANFLKLMQVIDKGMPLPFGFIENRRSLIYLDNLVDAVALCLIHPAAANETFLLSDNEGVSTPWLIQCIADALGKPARLFSVPEIFLRIVGAFTGRRMEIERLVGSLSIDNSAIRKKLGWEPPYTMQEGLITTSKWFKG